MIYITPLNSLNHQAARDFGGVQGVSVLVLSAATRGMLVDRLTGGGAAADLQC